MEWLIQQIVQLRELVNMNPVKVILVDMLMMMLEVALSDNKLQYILYDMMTFKIATVQSARFVKSRAIIEGQRR